MPSIYPCGRLARNGSRAFPLLQRHNQLIRIAIFIVSIALGALGAWAVGRYARKVGLLDCPNERSSHHIPTPKGGGIGIFVVFVLSATQSGLPTALWAPISVLAAIAFWGDRIDLPPKYRLYTQLFLMGTLVAGSGHLPPDPLWWIPFVVFWTVFIVGTANFYNFMDGINGIAGITGVIGFGLFGFYAHFNVGANGLSTVAVCLSCACLGFLPFNMPNAKVFMGDIGSILLGSVFAGLVFLTSGTLPDFLCLASFLFPFYADELTTMLVRVKDGQDLTKPHRRHIYQLLANEKEIPHWKISLGFGSIQLVVGVGAILMKPYGVFALFTFLAVCFVLFASLSFPLRASLEQSLQHR